MGPIRWRGSGWGDALNTRQILFAQGSRVSYSINNQEINVCVNIYGQSRPTDHVTSYTSFSQELHLSQLEAEGETERAEKCEKGAKVTLTLTLIDYMTLSKLFHLS